MPLSLGSPAAAAFVVEVLNYTFMSKLTAPLGPQPAGALPWGRQAFGEDASGSFHASDLELAALYTLAFHALATRDAAGLLGAPVPWNGSWTTLGDAAWASFERLRDDIGVGPHGLLRLLLSDHNDGLLGNLGVRGANFTTAVALGESVMNSAYGAYVLPLYAGTLELGGGPDAAARSAEVRSFASQLQAAVAAQWAAAAPAPAPAFGWFRRVYLGTAELGWRGDPSVDGVMWTETQAWAMLAGAAGAANVTVPLLAALATLAQDPSPLGAINAGPALSALRGGASICTAVCQLHPLPPLSPTPPVIDQGNGYGGLWYCGNLALVAALGLVSDEPVTAALREWRRNSLATHAAAYPAIWFGATSGPDVYDSVLSATPGATRCTWLGPGTTNPCNEASVPVLNLWSHTLPTFGLPGIIGFVPSTAGIALRAGSSAAGRLSVFTPLVSLVRDNVSAACNASGHYAPHVPPGSALEVSVELTPGDALQCAGVVVNGARVALSQLPGGVVAFNATTVAWGGGGGQPPRAPAVAMARAAEQSVIVWTLLPASANAGEAGSEAAQ